MPVLLEERAVERLRQVVDRARPAARPSSTLQPFARRALAQLARRGPRSARRGAAGAPPASRSARSAAGRAGRCACTSSLQNLSVMHMTKIQPSAVGKVCTGATERCALRGWRARHVALVQIPGRRVAELMQRDVEQAGVDVAALAGLARAQDAARAGRPTPVSPVMKSIIDGAEARGRRRRARRSGSSGPASACIR